MELEPNSNPSIEKQGAPGVERARRGRSPVDPVDADPSQRPGVPQERQPEPWPNSRFPIEPMRAKSSVPPHGRPGKRMPPVFSTAVPLRGLSGVIRKAAYRYPDHVARHWLLLLTADRVDSAERRLGRAMGLVGPALAVGLLLRFVSRR